MRPLIPIVCLFATLIAPVRSLVVTSEPPGATVPLDEQLTLNCSLATGGVPFWREGMGANLAYQLINTTDQLIAVHTIATVPAERNGSVLQCVGNLSNGTQLTSDVTVQVLYIRPNISIVSVASQVRIGESVILSCAPDAWPSATVSWWHNGSQVAEGYQLIRVALSFQVAGEYQCRANNSQGVAQSPSIVVSVAPARPAVFLYGNESAALNLTCQGTQISWTKSGLALSPSSLPPGLLLTDLPTRSVLFISALHQSLTGTYVCSQQGVVNSQFVVRIPNIADTFRAEPQSQGVFPGQILSLPCVAPSGDPPPLVSWYREGSDLPLVNTSALSLLDTGALVFLNFTESAAGGYSCVAHNLAGFRNVSFELAFMPLPTAHILPSGPLFLPEGQELTLTCNLTFRVAGIAFSWWRDGQRVGPGRELLVSQEGSYRCEVEVATSQSSVFVQSPLLEVLMSSLKPNGTIGNQVAREGDTLSVQCRTSGANATYEWFHQTLEIDAGGSDTLTLANITREQTGRYKCAASQVGVTGVSVEQVFNVSVRFGPFVAPFLPSLTIQEGQTGTLRCEVSGFPNPSLKWFRSVDNQTDQLINASLPSNTLLLRDVKLSDAGVYKCVARDPLEYSNSAAATIRLSVVPSGPALSPLSPASLPTILIPLCLAVAFSLLCVFGVILCVLLGRRWFWSRPRSSPRYSHELRLGEEGAGRGKLSPRAQYQPLGSEKILSGAGARRQAPEVSYPLIGFPREELCFGTRLGDGAYGPIIEGSIEQFLGERRHVAVECYISSSEEGSFPKPDELHTWPVFYLHHENLSRVLGICTSVEPYYVIYEYSDRGCLKEFLHSAKDQLPLSPMDSLSRSPGKRQSAVDVHFVLTQAHLLRMCRQAALGLEFLAQRDMIFRDVATRNCCISSSLDIKLINLPIGPNLFPGDYYRRDKEFLPVRWMPPESLQNSQFTTKSDVWAYGVFCWEVFTYARQPYETQSDEQVLEGVPAGLRLSPPEEGCPDGAYKLMNQCWHQNPDRRPSFSTLCVHLHDVTCDD